MKMNKKGFTLIELLAVITIMGILMLVAIPAVSRTIENSRRDTFGNLTKQYIETIRNAVIADELSCGGQSVSATTAGNYYFVITTDLSLSDTTGGTTVYKQNTIDLMESGGKSSWGNNDVIGMVAWKKEANTGTTSGFKTTYYAMLVDAGNHGIPTITEEAHIKRSSVLANTGSVPYTELNTLSKLQAKATVSNTTGAEVPGGLVFSGDGAAVQCTLNT